MPENRNSGLTYGVDGHLRRGEMVLVSVQEGKPGSFGRVIVGDAVYDIVRRTRSGWHFAIVQPPSESTVCEFVPFRVRSGGCLRCGNVEMQLRRRPLGSWQWYFKSMDGHGVLADARAGPEDRRLGGRSIEVRQRAGHTFDIDASALLVLVFGCWLIAQWEAVPMRASSGPPILGPSIL
jgi:hypothetical protein